VTQVTFSPLFRSLSSLDSSTSSSGDLRLLFLHTIWMLCQVHTFILPHNCLTQHGTTRCWSMSVPRHNLQWCILTTAAYTVHFHCDVRQSTGAEEMTLRMKYLQWSSHQACAWYVLAKYCFLTYLFQVPKSLCKQVSDELQRAYPLLWKLCKAVNKAWCALCSSVKLGRERSDCWAHRNTANKKHVSSGEFTTCSLHFAHKVNLLLKLQNQSLYF